MNEIIKVMARTLVIWWRNQGRKVQGATKITTTSTVAVVLMSSPTPTPIRIGVAVGLTISAMWCTATE